MTFETEQDLYNYLWNKMCDASDAHYDHMAKQFSKPESERDYEGAPKFYNPEAYAETKKAIKGPGGGTVIKKGVTVRIVMVSRLGDLGITTNLDAQHGYISRVEPGEGYLTNMRLTR